VEAPKLAGARWASTTRAALLLADAVLFLAVWYVLVDATLMASVDVLSPVVALLQIVPVLGAWLAVGYLFRRSSPDATHSARHAAIDGAIALLWFVVLPALFVHGFVFASFTAENRWIATEWHRVGMTLVATIHSAWYQLPFIIGLMSALVVMMLVPRLRWPARIIVLILLALMLFLDYRAEGYANLTMPHWAFPLFLLFAASFLRSKAWFARVAAANVPALIILLFYLGASPLPFLQSQPDPQFFTRLFPAQDIRHEALLFWRDGWVDRDGLDMFHSFGPSSGMARIDLDTGAFAGEPITYHGTIRFFWTDDASPWLFGANNTVSELLMFRKEPFALARRIPLERDGASRVPYDITAAPALNRLFLAFENPTGIAAYDMTTLEPVGEVLLREAGLTEFATAAIRVASEPASGKLFASFGSVDLGNNYRIARFDARTLAVEDQILVDLQGDSFILAPSINRAFAGDFSRGQILEVELFPKLRFLGYIPGPLCSRSMAFDAGRGFLYATSMVTGEFHVIDVARRKTLYSTFVGNKASNVFFHRGLDRVYVSSARGVFLFDPATFERSLGAGADADSIPAAEVPR
jgi:hypothetical protein